VLSKRLKKIGVLAVGVVSFLGLLPVSFRVADELIFTRRFDPEWHYTVLLVWNDHIELRRVERLFEVSPRPKDASYTFSVPPQRQRWVEEQVQNAPPTAGGAAWAIKVTQLGLDRQRIELEAWKDGFSGLIYEARPGEIIPLNTKYAGPLDSATIMCVHLLCWGSGWLGLMGVSRWITRRRKGAVALAFACCSLSLSAQTIQHAEKFPGADAGQKISQCIAALPPQGGICDARELSGQQTAASGFNVGTPNQPVELMLGPVTLLTKGTIHVQAKSSIVGMPASAGIGSDQSPTVIKAGDATALNVVVQLDGPFAVLQDVTVDGNKKNSPKGGVAILVNAANRIEMFRVTAQNAPTYGIEIYSTERNESCCAKLSKMMSIGNGQAGLHLANTADVFISLSEFEDNEGYGIELNNSPTTRIEHSDVGGNALDGIRVYGTGTSRLQSNRQIIVGNQFGNNAHYDINIVGFDYAAGRHVSTGNLISSNEFIGSPTRPAGYEAIHIVDSGENTILGNTFSAPAGHRYSSCIGISGDKEVADNVTGNTCSGTAASKDAFTGTPTTVYGPNQGKGAPKASPSPK
jgi:hypothetical protein